MLPKYKLDTSKRIITQKRIAVPAMDLEFKEINMATVEAGVSRGQFVQEILNREEKCTLQ